MYEMVLSISTITYSLPVRQPIPITVPQCTSFSSFNDSAFPVSYRCKENNNKTITTTKNNKKKQQNIL
jgi:hypothetical protein